MRVNVDLKGELAMLNAHLNDLMLENDNLKAQLRNRKKEKNLFRQFSGALTTHIQEGNSTTDDNKIQQQKQEMVHMENKIVYGSGGREGRNNAINESEINTVGNPGNPVLEYII